MAIKAALDVVVREFLAQVIFPGQTLRCVAWRQVPARSITVIRKSQFACPALVVPANHRQAAIPRSKCVIHNRLVDFTVIIRLEPKLVAGAFDPVADSRAPDRRLELGED